MKNFILVTGGRDYVAGVSVTVTLDAIHAASPITLLFEGGCETGADMFARSWAVKNDVHHATVSAIWRSYKGGPLRRSAGPIRNSVMALLNIDKCVVFPGGDGTADMRLKAKRSGFEMIEVGAE